MRFKEATTKYTETLKTAQESDWCRSWLDVQVVGPGADRGIRGIWLPRPSPYSPRPSPHAGPVRFAGVAGRATRHRTSRPNSYIGKRKYM